jgi:hypothetical protein
MGILERGGKVRTKVIADRKKKVVQAEIRKHMWTARFTQTGLRTSGPF